jgi:hypothetical protein
VIPSAETKRRHRRKYAEGELADDKSFYFRGPDGRLNLRAYNLIVFLDLADGVDAATWQFHRERGDYSKWIDAAIKDSTLAGEVADIERSGADVETAKAAVRSAVEKSYTLPA